VITMLEHNELDDHEKFKELAALANWGTLTNSEWSMLRGHYQTCEACRELYGQYLILIMEGMPLLATRDVNEKECGSWDDTATRRKLLDRVRAQRPTVFAKAAPQLKMAMGSTLLSRIPTALGQALLAACLVGAIGIVAYRLGNRTSAEAQRPMASTVESLRRLVAEKQKAADKLEELLDAQTKNTLRMREEGLRSQQELINLRANLRRVEDRASELERASNVTNEQLQNVSQQRDALSGQVRDAERKYLNIQAELASRGSERDEALRRNVSLESRMKDLSILVHNQERRIADDEQYLASDRDIRELMGARGLYIADVFDVDSRSRTRKPFGRVFYTQGKSLIFYAFDLDGRPNLQSASAFQAWGRKETDKEKPLNLGILYLDSQTNRRWVLRFDDPQQLAEIDAVFVTVEPQGGSQKPTGKPFLYALLRKEANHP
jgi:hypothetical protein